jgi:MoaA/NifB/PqqE/SkfB family radical SAM enzyme
MSEGLVLAGLDTLVVSVDGTTSESHKEIRPGADLNTVRRNVKQLRAISRKHSCKNPEIGIEFVLMKRNLSELSNLRQLAYSMGANFIILTNVIPYTEELMDEILYWYTPGSFYSFPRSRWTPDILLPRIDATLECLTALAEVLKQGGGIDLLESAHGRNGDRCPFVYEGSVAVSWNGDLSPCVALMHFYTCYVMGREKSIRRYTIGNIAQQKITHIWNSQEYKDFRKRVLEFDFSPCIICGGCD